MVQSVVQWPVVGLRQLPGHSPGLRNGLRWPKDPMLDSQLLHGDRVEILASCGDWSWVAVPTQPCFRGQWQPYTGWVPTEALTATEGVLLRTLQQWTLPVHVAPEGPCETLLGRGSRLLARNPSQREDWQELATGGWVAMRSLSRPEISGLAALESLAVDWLDTPYLWGGVSAHVPGWREHRSGVDCSGLIWALWRALGRVVPRDSHDQWLVAKPLGQAGDLRMGDLVFFSGPESRPRIHHVMLALDADRLIEASGSKGCVHFSNLAERCRVTKQTPSGVWTGNYRVWFGRLPYEGGDS